MLHAAVGCLVWADIPPQKRAKMWHDFEEAGSVGVESLDVRTGCVGAVKAEAWLGAQERRRIGFQDARAEDAFEQLQAWLCDVERPCEDP